MGKKERVKVNAYFINHLNGQRVLCNVHVEEKRIRGGTEAGESKEEEDEDEDEEQQEDEEKAEADRQENRNPGSSLLY